MTATTPSLEMLKRRQAVQVTAFLVAVAAATAGLFYLLRADLVAYRRGEQALARGDFTEASAQLGTAWAKGYRTTPVRLDLARALLATGRREEALTLYLEALAAAPGDAALIEAAVGLYQETGRPEKGLELSARLGAPADLPVDTLARLGDLQQQAGHHEAAAAMYRLAVQRSPQSPGLQLRLGIVLSWIGRRAEAIEALRAAVALAPENRQARLQLARVLSWDGRFAEAVDEYRRGLSP